MIGVDFAVADKGRRQQRTDDRDVSSHYPINTHSYTTGRNRTAIS